MRPRSLGEPKPLSSNRHFVQWTVEGEKVYLPIPLDELNSSVSTVLASRRCRRRFSAVSLCELSKLLWHCCRTQRVEQHEKGCPTEYRPLPSAGGCHAVELIVLQPEGAQTEIGRYQPHSHSLINIATGVTSQSLREMICSVLNPEEGTVIVFAGDMERIGSRYDNGESLLWRDAGVLICGLAIVAEAMGLAFCPLGCTCEAIVNELFPAARFVGLGGCVVGRTVPSAYQSKNLGDE